MVDVEIQTVAFLLPQFPTRGVLEGRGAGDEQNPVAVPGDEGWQFTKLAGAEQDARQAGAGKRRNHVANTIERGRSIIKNRRVDSHFLSVNPDFRALIQTLVPPDQAVHRHDQSTQNQHGYDGLMGILHQQCLVFTYEIAQAREDGDPEAGAE